MKTIKRLAVTGALMLAFCAAISGCGAAATTAADGDSPTDESSNPAGSSDQTPVAGGKMLESNLARVLAPNVSADDLTQLVRGNSAFAVSLYQELRSRDGNLFFSPYSISLCLAMLYGGARGSTEAQMADALHFTLPQDRLHPAFNSLDLTIAAYEKAYQDPATKTDRGFTLDIANSIWGQDGFPFLPAYLDLLAQNYGAGMHLTDFVNSPDAARQNINDWIEQQTNDKIQDLLPERSIDSLTRLVLANAIYFKALWKSPFDPADTKDGTFHLLDGATIRVPMMSTVGPGMFPYSEGETYQAVGLPYQGGGILMALVMPAAGKFSSFETGLTDAQLESILTAMHNRSLILTMPKFGIDSKFDLNDTLNDLGMTDAFENADFSGVDGEMDLSITDVIHQAFVRVDETGTEAAAATIGVMGLTGGPTAPLVLTIDRPFLFLIYDSQTHTILFLGRVLNPGK